MERAFRHSTRALGLAVCLLGIAMVVTSVARGAGPLSLGVLVGVAFALLGAGRAYLASAPADLQRRR